MSVRINCMLEGADKFTAARREDKDAKASARHAKSKAKPTSTGVCGTFDGRYLGSGPSSAIVSTALCFAYL